MRFEGRDFSHQTVTLDGNEYVGCVFRDSTLVVLASGEPSLLRDCELLKPWRLVWGGEAEKTLLTLSRLYQESAESAALVDTLFEHIRRGQNPLATLAQLSWEELKVRPGGLYTVQSMMQWYRQGPYGRETMETLFAHIRSGDFRQLSEAKRKEQ